MKVENKCNLIYIITFSLLCLSSCNQKRLNAESYLEFIESDKANITVSETVGDLMLTMQYKPVNYQILINEDKDSITNENIGQYIDSYSKMHYVLFKIKSLRKNVEPLELTQLQTDKEYAIRHLIYDMMADFKIIDGEDTLNCEFYHWERTYHVTDYILILLAFDKRDDARGNKDITLLYNDQLFGIGMTAFKLPKEKLDNLPLLKL